VSVQFNSVMSLCTRFYTSATMTASDFFASGKSPFIPCLHDEAKMKQMY